MTDEPKKPEEETESADSASSGADDSSAAETPTEESAASVTPDQPKKSDKPDSDPLPETGDRSAEFAEEEAVRGDFVLRWAIVLLAMMLGFTRTDDSRALMHATSGDYMQANGFLPPRADVFSSSAEGQSWIQLSWLFDHVAAFLQTLPDSGGFTLLTCLLGGLAFGYAVHTALPNVSTWWTTICMAFALMACYPRFTPTPELVTLAFTAMTLAWLYKWQTRDKGGFPIRIPILFLVWANCDPRMWIGLMIVALYAVGHAIDRLMGRSGWTLAERSKHVWLLLIACAVASLANPFIHESLTQPLRQYTVEYPAMREYKQLTELRAPTAMESTVQYYGLLKPEVWMARQKSTIAGAIIILISLTFFVVNLKHMDTGYLLVLLGVTVLTAVATHELAVAALVAAVLAGLNGQDWFRHNFRNEYTTDKKTFVFSQGGRAVTVLGLAFFAFLAVSGRLTGPQGVRIGYGLDTNLIAAVEGIKSDLEEVEKDARIFNFTPEQGDLLLYAGYKPFVDSRISVFADRGSEVLDTHLSTRRALRLRASSVMQTQRRDDPAVWQKTLEDYEITHVTPRLYVSPGSGLPADYGTYFDLLQTGKWNLTKLGRATAVFTPLKAGARPTAVRFVDLGLDTRTKDVPVRLDWARGPSFYDEYMLMPKKVYRGDSQMTQHYRRQMIWLYRLYTTTMQQAKSQQVAQRAFEVYMPDLAAASHLTLQSANTALSIDSEDAVSYRAIGDAQLMLNNVEQDLARGLRYRLAIAAYRQSLTADPNQPDLYLDLFRIYRENRRAELAVDMLSEYLSLVDNDSISEKDAEQLELQYRTRNQLREQNTKNIEQVVKIRSQMKERSALTKSDGPPTPEDNLRRAEELVEFCSKIWDEAGLTKHALKTLEEDMEVVQGFPPALFLWGRLLLENGDFEEANTAFLQLEQLAKQKNSPVGQLQWESEAAVSAMIGADYQRARELWNSQYTQLEKSTNDISSHQSKMGFLPFLGSMQLWPETQTGGRRGDGGLSSLLIQIPSQIAAVRFQIALSLFEEGNGQKGADLMRQLVDKAPSSQISQLARFYYTLVKRESLNYDFDAGYVSLDLNEPAAKEEPAKEEPANAGEAGGDENEYGKKEVNERAAAADKEE